MSAVQPALTSTEKSHLATLSSLRSWLVGQPVATSFATARVNAPSGLTWPVADIPVDSTSADWTSAQFGMTCWVGSTAGAKDRGVYWLSKAPGSSVLHIGNVGEPDGGIETLQTRPVSIQDDDYITIFETYQLHAGHSRIQYSVGNTFGTFYKFFDLGYSDQNTKPDCYFQGDTHKNYRLPSGSSNVAASVSITPVCQLASQSVISYQWTVPASWTSVSGDTTSTVSGNAPLGWHTLYCLVVLSDGTGTLCIRYVVVWNETTATPITTDASDERDRSGRKITVTFEDDLRAQIDSESAAMIIDAPNWSGGTVPTATTQFFGWLNTETITAEYGKRGSQVEMLGVGGILATLGSDSQRIQQVVDALDWTQVPSDLITLTYFIWYLLRWHVVNWNALFCYYPLPSSMPQSSNPLDAAKATFLAQVQSVALRAGYANCGTDSDGDLHVHPQPSLEDPDTRSVIIRDVITPDLVANVTFNVINRPPHRHDIVGAFIYDGTTMQAVRSWAPSEEAGQGSGEEELQSTIIDSQDNNDLFIGLYYQKNNQRYQSITFTIPGNRDVYEVVHMTRVQYTVDAKFSPTGQDITGYGIPLSVTKRRGEDGETYIDLTLEPETSGTRGKPYPYPPQQTSPYGDAGNTSFASVIPSLTSPIPVQNDFSPVTAPSSKIKFAVLVRDSGNTEFRVVRIDQLSPSFKATDISPTSGQRTSLGKPIKLTRDPTNQAGYFLLCDSGIAYTANGMGSTVKWTVVSNSTNYNTIYDFTLSPNGFIPTPVDGSTGGDWINGTGWHSDLDSFGRPRILLNRFYSNAFTVSQMEIFYQTAANGSGGTRSVGVNGVPGYAEVLNTGIGTFDDTFGLSPVNTGTSQVEIILDTNIFGGGPSIPNIVTKLIVSVSAGTNISGIAISKGGNIYWLSKLTVGGTDYVFCNYTRTGFKATGSTQIATYNANMTYNIQISPYNPAWVWVSAGDPANTDATIYFSSNGAVSFTAGAALSTHGGAFRLPRSLPGGGQNRAAANIVYIQGIDTNLYGERDGFSRAQIASGSSDYQLSSHALNSFYLDGNYVALILKSRDTYISNDGGKSFTFVTTAPGTGDAYSLEVWPSNRKYIVMGGDQALAYSTDRAVTWTDFYGDFATWAAAQFGSGIATVILNVLPALWTIYRTLG